MDNGICVDKSGWLGSRGGLLRHTEARTALLPHSFGPATITEGLGLERHSSLPQTCWSDSSVRRPLLPCSCFWIQDKLKMGSEGSSPPGCTISNESCTACSPRNGGFGVPDRGWVLERDATALPCTTRYPSCPSLIEYPLQGAWVQRSNGITEWEGEGISRSIHSV